MEHGCCVMVTELHEQPEDAPQRELEVGPVTSPVPGVDDVTGTLERGEDVAVAGLEPPHLGLGERLDPTVPGTGTEPGRLAEQSEALVRLGTFEGDAERVRRLGARGRRATRPRRGLGLTGERRTADRSSDARLGHRTHVQPVRQPRRRAISCRHELTVHPADRFPGAPEVAERVAEHPLGQPAAVVLLGLAIERLQSDLDARHHVTAHEVAEAHDRRHHGACRMRRRTGDLERSRRPHGELVADPSERELT